jgi:hypothetical protein
VALRDGHRARLAATLFFAFTAAARAESPSSSRSIAQVLFDEGRELLAAGKYAEACRKFAESQRLDPGGGTVLNLALCHEKEGKIATAWADFREALGAARRDQRAEREKLAREHLDALEPRLPKLTLRVTPSTAPVEVTLDGTAVNASAWNTPFPIDPGTHRIEATASGKKTWSTNASLRERESIVVVVPRLENDVGSVAGASAPSPAPSNGESVTAEGNGRRTLGYVAGGVALVAAGVGTYFGVAALREGEIADRQGCGRDSCPTQDAFDHNQSAISNAWISNASFGVGLVAAGFSVYWILSSKSAAKAAASSSALARQPLVFGQLGDKSGGFVGWRSSW